MPKWNRANVLLALFFLVRFQIQATSWKHLSSSTGDLPIPGRSTQQTGAVVADFNKDGTNDFVLSFRQVAPALVLYQKTGIGWDRLIIETNYLTIEAGGAVYDIDGDGDLDLVFGGDWQSNEVWWWENPFPNFKPDQRWKRHNIKKSGAKQHHDQVFADFLGEGKAQLAFWNQGANKIYLARIPDSLPDPWELLEVFSGNAGVSGKGEFKYPEGLAAFDIDSDGKFDLLAGNLWLRNRGNHVFTPVPFASIGGRIAAAKLKRGKYPQVVIAPGDGIGPLRWYDCNGDPEKPTDWLSHDLLSAT